MDRGNTLRVGILKSSSIVSHIIFHQQISKTGYSMDKIYIRELSLETVIGIYGWEREIKQQVIIDVELECDLRKAGETDAIEDTVNYKTMRDEIKEHVESSSYGLIEKLAETISALCLNYTGVTGVRVTIHKPGALTLCKSVAVEIYRTK